MLECPRDFLINKKKERNKTDVIYNAVKGIISDFESADSTFFYAAVISNRKNKICRFDSYTAEV